MMKIAQIVPGMSPNFGGPSLALIEMTRALKRMLESEVLRRELGDKARTFVLQRYTNTAVASAYLTAFKGLLPTN